MSHIATGRAFRQRGLKPSAKLILPALADGHNPAHGCFPSQAFLADASETNRDTVDAQLGLLENRGLIRRIRSVDPVAKRQRPTRCKRASEDDFAAEDRGSQPPNGEEKPVPENPTPTLEENLVLAAPTPHTTRGLSNLPESPSSAS